MLRLRVQVLAIDSIFPMFSMFSGREQSSRPGRRNGACRRIAPREDPKNATQTHHPPRGEARRGREGIQARCRPGMRDSTAQYFGGAKLCYD